MTELQIKKQQLQETIRANKAQESERARQRRTNYIMSRKQLQEDQRHNKVTENVSKWNATANAVGTILGGTGSFMKGASSLL